MEVWIRQGMAYRAFSDRPTPFPVPGWMWDRELGLGLYDQRMQYIQRIDELGFDGLIFTEHHYGPNGGLTPSPNLMIAAASQVTERIKLITMGIILSLHAHPVRVAEETAMLDNLSHGRLVAGFISGNAESHYAYSMPPQEGRARQREAFDLIVKAWTEENPFPWHGEFFHYDCVSILPRPLQAPYPPAWTTAGSAESLEWAAQHQIGLIGSGPTPQATQTLDYYQRYAEAECAWTPGPQDRGLARELYLAPTMAQARRTVDEVILGDRAHAYPEQFVPPELDQLERAKYTARSHAYLGGAREGRRARAGRSFEEIVERGVYLVGDPDAVARQILRQREESNTNVLVIRPEMASLSVDEVTRMMELFAREVLPVIQRA
ncbi:MAG: LLM class flavin-dependent oxidoreductase [Chloroflexi bacterium]|nr:LLM class flavin-dependent oxidoreductase [Chloroflexota bacterium]